MSATTLVDRASRVLRLPIIRVAVLIVVLGAACLALVSQWSSVRSGLRETSLLAIVGSSVIAALALLVNAGAFRVLVTEFGGEMRRIEGIRIYLVGQLGKYVPGSVVPVLMQGELGADIGVSRRTVLGASIAQVAVNCVSGGVVAAVTVPFIADDARPYLVLALPVAVASAALLHPRMLNGAIGLLCRLVGRPSLEHVISTRGVIRALGYVSIVWLLNGVHLFVLARELGADSPRDLVTSIGGYALAWTAGFLFVVAPSGAGVREGVLVALFSVPLGAGAALTLALLSRLVLTVADLLAGIVAAAFLRRTSSTADVPPDIHR